MVEIGVMVNVNGGMATAFIGELTVNRPDRNRDLQMQDFKM